MPTGLVLQGGGARGAYQAGVLLAISEILQTRTNPFPIICGASVGAINAASLAATANDFRRSARKLNKLWEGLTSAAIFDTSAAAVAKTSASWLWALTLGKGGSGDPMALLDNAPLRALLEEEYARRGVERSFACGSLQAFCITASSYEAGQAVSFFECAKGHEGWQRVRRVGLAEKIDVDHLMASSALPFVFPAVRLKNGFFGDGALRLTAPLSPAIRLGANRILVIGVRDADPEPVQAEEDAQYPSIGAMGGHALDILFNDNLDADIERLERINWMLTQLRPEAVKTSPFRKVDIKVLQPSQDLRSIARRHESEMPRSIRLLLKSIGAWHTDGRLPSYLLFEPGYIKELSTLGYEDTMARLDEVRDFLDGED